MTINENFVKALSQSGLSMYALSKRSGVPYTTIYEIHRGKNDINSCAAATVWRLAAALGVSPEDLVNEILYLEGIEGKHKGIKYAWHISDTSTLQFDNDGESVILDAGALYNIPSRLPFYRIIAEMMIDEYLENVQWTKEANRIARRESNR